jgi:hypothetical protein
MPAIPAQLLWRRFAQLLRDLGYHPSKPHRGSLRQFFNPTRNLSQISFHEPHPGDTLHKARLFDANSSSHRMNLFDLLDKH